jgi:hypothetical protein
VLVTEQYPKGLKHTAGEIVERLPAELKPIEKSCFSSCGADDFISQLTSGNVKQVLVCGIEAHICVLQTSLDLLARGFEVFLLVDCITSRRSENKLAALARLTQAGAIQATLEMVLFEMMRTADSPQFKAIQGLISRNDNDNGNGKWKIRSTMLKDHLFQFSISLSFAFFIFNCRLSNEGS